MQNSSIYQLQSVLRGISPLIGRRLLVRSDTTVAQLHEVFQIDAEAGSFLVREGGAMRSCP